MKRFVFSMLWLAMLACIHPSGTVAQETSNTVYVIPIDGVIDRALVYVVRRGAMEAERVNASAIVFDIDTPGGRLDAIEEIVNIIEHIPVPTYTFVRDQAISGGAIISLATERIYMAEGSVIGDAMPIMAPGGQPQDMPENLQEKMVSATAAIIRSAAEQGGHDKELAEAMVRRENEYRIGDLLICPEGELLTLTNIEAAQPVERNGEEGPLLSSGTMSSFDDMLRKLQLGDARIVRLEVTSLERFARVIELFAAILLAAGIFFTYQEFRTPGFGIPIMLAALCFALFFLGHHIAGLAGMEEALLVILGLALIVVEIFILPGFGIVGLSGVFCLCWGLVMAMVQHYPGGPIMPTWTQLEIPVMKLSGSFLITMVLGAIAGRYLPTSRLMRGFRLQESVSSEAGYTASQHLAPSDGTLGKAVTDLRPGGTALIEDHRMDVITQGEYVDKGATIRVIHGSGSHILVEEAP